MINSINSIDNDLLRQYYLNAYSSRAAQNTQNGYNPFASSCNDIEWLSLNADKKSSNLNETANAIKASQNKQETKTNKTETKEETCAKTSEKSAVNQTASVLGQDFFNKITFGRGSILTKLTEVTPFTVASAVLGVNFEEDGAAMKEGAKTGKGGDYSEGYKNLFSRIDQVMNKCAKEGGLKNVMGAFGQVLSFIPNAGSTGITNTLKYIGAGLSKIGAPKIAEALGSSVELVGTVLNSIGQGVVTSGKNLGGAIVSLFKGKPGEALDSLKKLGQDFKNMGIKIKDKVLDTLNSGKELLLKGGQLVLKGLEKAKESVKKVLNKLNPLNWFRRL